MSNPIATSIPATFIVTQDGQRAGTYTNEAEAQAAAQQLRTLLESRQNAAQPIRVEVKRQING